MKRRRVFEGDVEIVSISLPIPMWKQVGWASIITAMDSRPAWVRATLKAAIDKLHQEVLLKPQSTARSLDLVAFADASALVDSSEEQARMRAASNASVPHVRPAGQRKIDLMTRAAVPRQTAPEDDSDESTF